MNDQIIKSLWLLTSGMILASKENSSNHLKNFLSNLSSVPFGISLVENKHKCGIPSTSTIFMEQFVNCSGLSFTNLPIFSSIVASMLQEDHSNNYKYVFFNVAINNFNVRVSLYFWF